MTACVNNQNENKGGVSHKVLRSVVAGAMAVSMVPSVALADTVTTESEVAPLASDNAAWSRIKVTFNVEPDAKDNYSFVYTGEAVDFEVTGVALYTGEELEEDEDYTWAFYTSKSAGAYTGAANGASESGAAPSKPGTYYIGVADVNTPTNIKWQEFTIKAASLDGVDFYQVDAEDTDNVSDKTLTYSGNPITASSTADGSVWVQIDGVPVDPKYVDVAFDGTANADGVTDAGSYKIKVTGKDIYAGMVKYLDVTVNPFDLSKATVEINDIQYTGGEFDVRPAVITDGDTTISETLLGDAVVVDYEAPNAGGVPQVVSAKGTYTVEYKTAETVAKNIINSVKGEFDVAGDLASITYSKTSTNQGTESDPFAEEFDPEKLSVKNSGGSVALDEDLYSVTVTKDGNSVTKYDAPGLYKVEVEVSDETYAYAGSKTFYFQVYAGDLAKTETFVTVNKVNVNKVSEAKAIEVADYTGEAYDVSVVVEDEEGNVLKQGTDYNVQLMMKNGATYVEADAALNHGTYMVKITSDTYNIEDEGFYFTIGQAEVKSVRVAGLKTVYTSEAGFAKTAVSGLAYTGEEIVPVLEYSTEVAANAADEDVEWKTLPVENYKLAVQKTDDADVTKLTEAGKYTIALTEVDPKIDNFDLQVVEGADKIKASEGNAGYINVIDTTCFKDVKANDWFAVAATSAANMGIFAGNDGGAFLPNAAMTRAEAVQVFSKMAQIDYTNKNLVDKYIAVAVDSFDDVKATDWFAAALGWAKTVGLVSGNGEGSFNPADQITREQFAVMLANYETTFGAFEAPEGDVLAGYADADTVSSWAKNALAWAVENKIMGAGDTINAQGLISRAEAATMVVNYIG